MKLTYRDFLTASLSRGIELMIEKYPEMKGRFEYPTIDRNFADWIVKIVDKKDSVEYTIIIKTEDLK